MAPYPQNPARQSPRETALIADVLDSLNDQLRSADASGDAAAADQAAADGVQDLISAAMGEIHRLSSLEGHRGGVGLVLGSGVVQSLMRQKHTASVVPSVHAGDTVDERR